MLRTSPRESGHGRADHRRELAPPDLLFQSDLKRALRQSGCPACRLIREADRHYLVVFLREGKDDGRMLLRLLGSWGLCAGHADVLVRLEPVEHGDGLGTGTLYDWLLGQGRRYLDDLRKELERAGVQGSASWRRGWTPGRKARRQFQRMTRRDQCPACEARKWQADYIVQRFVRTLELAAELQEFPSLYQTSDGLCVPHWRAIGTWRPSAAVSALVSEKQGRVLVSLKAALDSVLTGGPDAQGKAENGEHSATCATALAAMSGETRWMPFEHTAQRTG